MRRLTAMTVRTCVGLLKLKGNPKSKGSRKKKISIGGHNDYNMNAIITKAYRKPIMYHERTRLGDIVS